MKAHQVSIGTELNPDPIVVAVGDTVTWINGLTPVQTVSSDDGGQTFTTGPIQPGGHSLPITFLADRTVPYTCKSRGLHGIVIARREGGVVGFAARIKPYFTAEDRAAMNDANHTFGIIVFDLWSRADCEANWQAIHDAIANMSMPPAEAGGPWPAAKIQQFVADFTSWKAGGFGP